MTLPFTVRAMALGGWLLTPITPALHKAGVTKLVVNLGPPGSDYDLLVAHTRTAPFDAHVRVGRSALRPWFQFVDDGGRARAAKTTLAEAVAQLEHHLTGERSTPAATGDTTT